MRHSSKKILLAHGGGGRLTRALVDEVFLSAFDNELLSPLNDQAVFTLPNKPLAFTTDSYVVDPIFFPGGDIGKLSICGTINDLAVGGAMPVYLSASFIIEEGLLIDELSRIVESMARTARTAGVKIVTGDTKVVEKGKGDRIFINTAGIGVLYSDLALDPRRIAPGDVVILSGYAGDHGMAVLTRRTGIMMDVPIESDCAPLFGLAKAIMDAGGASIKAMRDPTRGGVATVLNEFAVSSGTCIRITEGLVPVRNEVRGACEVLGFDPLYLANEGKLIAIVAREDAQKVLMAMKADPHGIDAAIIGEVLSAPSGKVLLETPIGNTRFLDMLSGEQLPRIC